MKKKLNIIFYSLVVFAVLYYFLKFTGMCALYSVPSTASEPNIKRGSFILVSNLITPKRGDFITYIYKDSVYGNNSMIHRLCGVANDTIQIKEGVLFVNGTNFDEQYNLQYSYLLSQAQLNNLKPLSLENIRIEEDSFLTYIQDIDAEKYTLENYRLMDLKDKADDFIEAAYQQNWNKDHFGPLIIPEGSIFVLGDNRDNSRDSRHTGLIDKNAITGVYWMTLYTIDYSN